MKMKKYELGHVTLEGKSYAECFRQFWAHFMNEDLDKTVNTIAHVGIRTSDSEFFVAKNGSKKKNIRLGDTDTWVYTHLTPKAMEKVYDKFIAGWEGRYILPEDKPVATEPEPETNDDASNTEIEESQDENHEENEIKFLTHDELAQEKYGKNYDELPPSHKGVITKKYKAQEKEKQLTSEEIDAVEI